MTEYGDMTLDQYRDAMASKSPTPGGGSAAAVALSQGAALAVMVCNLTEGNEKWKSGWEAADICRAVATPLLERGYQLAHEDAHSFDGVMAAFKMPKNTAEEVDARKAAIQNGTLEAAKVPMETATHAYELLVTLPQLAMAGNANAVTDVGVAGLLVSAACKGALFNVEININSLPDEMALELRTQLDSLRGSCQNTAREIMNAVYERMQS